MADSGKMLEVSPHSRVPVHTPQSKPKQVHYPFWFGGSASCFAASVTHPLDLGMLFISSLNYILYADFAPTVKVINCKLLAVRDYGLWPRYRASDADIRLPYDRSGYRLVRPMRRRLWSERLYTS
ncbi:hypothetical protein VN97_g9159 [Penicillium thymicola]|uniref:Uncharacterized protein n=1 Tax=Penicillium thymicola TaxID=293382 RepID=A0AAI9TBE3_PENTH|nr:hypothetical protein VN97_g9159 [Penicillium thymicola]